jgi:hypothetical protein
LAVTEAPEGKLRGYVKKVNQAAMNLLGNLLERTTNYELKRAAFRYMIQYQIDRGDYFKGLELAKRFFVEARGQYDFDMVVLSSNVILNALARLRQEDKIAEFLSDKKLASLLPPQTELAYATYSLLAANKSAEVVKRFKQQEKNLIKPIHPAILYNTAEAFFREAEYEEAARVYDMFISEWAHLREAAAARLRLALTYELLDRKAAETTVLYKNAIDRSPYPEYRYEAKLRYVGMRIARKIAPDAADIETEVFLEQAVDEKKIVTDFGEVIGPFYALDFLKNRGITEIVFPIRQNYEVFDFFLGGKGQYYGFSSKALTGGSNTLAPKLIHERIVKMKGNADFRAYQRELDLLDNLLQFSPLKRLNAEQVWWCGCRFGVGRREHDVECVLSVY